MLYTLTVIFYLRVANGSSIGRSSLGIFLYSYELRKIPNETYLSNIYATVDIIAIQIKMTQNVYIENIALTYFKNNEKGNM